MAQVNNYKLENFDPEVLREYDIRGVVGENINENTAYTIGRTFGHTVKSKLLQDQGIVIKSYDPEAMDNAKKENTELQLCNSAYEACEDTKAIIIGTEWNEFRALDFLKIRGSSKNLVIFDLRNIYNAKEITDLGFQYFGTGK